MISKGASPKSGTDTIVRNTVIMTTSEHLPIHRPLLLRESSRSILICIVGAAVYCLLARVGMDMFSLRPSNITLVWLPSGIALVLALTCGWRAFPTVFVASFIANFPGLHVESLAHSIGFTAAMALIDASAGIISAYMFRRFIPDGLRRATDLVPFCLWVVIIPTIATSAGLALMCSLGHYIAWQDAPAFAGLLIFGDGLGFIFIYPIFQGWRDQDGFSRAAIRPLLLGAAVLALLFGLGFAYLPGLILLVVPVLLVLSFQVGLLEIAIATAVALLVIVTATAHGVGPLIAPTAIDTHFRLMSFIFGTALSVLGIALQNAALARTEKTTELWREAAERDPLTGLINRRAFSPILDREHNRSRRTGRPYTVAMLDLDHFKRVNDKYGHAAGDQILQVFSSLISGSCRAADTVARIGGEEFAIVLPDCRVAEATIVLDRIRLAMAERVVEIAGNPVAVTVSIGVAESLPSDDAPASIVCRADDALYEAKASGRNRVTIG